MIIHALANRPMTGYDIIQFIEKTSHGLWKPSPGSIYPTLQLLVEKDQATVQEEGSKKIYSLTDTGQALVRQESHNPYSNVRDKHHYPELRNLVHSIATTTKSLAITANPQAIQQITTILEETLQTLQELQTLDDHDQSDKDQDDEGQGDSNEVW